MKINASPTFTTPVKLTVRGQDELAEISVTWKHMDRDQVKRWMGRPLPTDDTGVITVAVEAAYLSEAIASWDGPVDDAGVAVPYSVGALGNLLRAHHTAGQELYNQYIKALSESRVKN